MSRGIRMTVSGLAVRLCSPETPMLILNILNLEYRVVFTVWSTFWDELQGEILFPQYFFLVIVFMFFFLRERRRGTLSEAVLR